MEWPVELLAGAVVGMAQKLRWESSGKITDP
jgi:hypothetical protein